MANKDSERRFSKFQQKKKKFALHLLNNSIPAVRVFESVPVKPETASRWLRGECGRGVVTLPRAQAAAAAWTEAQVAFLLSPSSKPFAFTPNNKPY